MCPNDEEPTLPSRVSFARVLPAIYNQENSVMGEFTDKVSAAGNKVAGNVKEAVGKATDNERLEAEGKAQQLKGTAQDVKGSVKGALGDKI